MNYDDLKNETVHNLSTTDDLEALKPDFVVSLNLNLRTAIEAMTDTGNVENGHLLRLAVVLAKDENHVKFKIWTTGPPYDFAYSSLEVEVPVNVIKQTLTQATAAERVKIRKRSVKVHTENVPKIKF